MTAEQHIQNAKLAASRGKIQAALTHIDAALLVDPSARDTRLFRVRLLQNLGRFSEALTDLNRIDDLNVGPKFASLKAELEFELNLLDHAVSSLNRAIKHSPGTPTLLVQRSRIFRAKGDYKSAQKDIRQALRLLPENGELHRLHSDLHSFTKADPWLQKMQLLHRKSADGANRMALEFALFKAFDDIGQYDKAFDYLVSANASMRKRFPYDSKRRFDQVALYKSGYESFKVTSIRHASPTGPIFIMGLPRSGTTLVEQILGRHSQVAMAGETGAFGRLLQAELRSKTDVSSINREALKSIGTEYQKLMKGRFPGSMRITDKSLQTYMYMGHVARAIPDAKFVLVKRDPIAVAFSQFKHVFREGRQLFTYDLGDIRSYQQAFEGIIDFWRQRFGTHLFEIQYEELVQNSNSVVENLLGFLELDWQDACLTPERSAEAVKTLSGAEVRKPIHTGNISKWRNYEEYFLPLYNI